MDLSAMTTRTSSSSTASRAFVSPIVPSTSSKLQQQQRINPVSKVTLTLSRSHFRAYWLLFFVTHVLSIAVCLGVIVVNRYLQDDDIGDILVFLGGSPRYFLKHVVVANALLLAGHLYELLKMVFHSVFHKRLLFSAPIEQQPTKIQEGPSSRAVTSMLSQSKSTLSGVISFFTTMFARKGSFGIEGAHYDAVYMAVEVVSITVRVFQAYCISTWIPRLWINRLFVLFAMLSCFSIPALKLWILPAQQLKKRMALLVADSTFDFITSMMLPTAIAIPYVLKYDTALADFPLINYYMDTWFVQAVSENQLVFAVSWFDFLSKNYPKFSCFFAMALIKTSISERCELTANGKRQFKRPPFRKRGVVVAPTSALVTFASSPMRLPSVEEITTLVRDSWRQRAVSKSYWLHNGFFILSGLFVLTFHALTVMRTWGGDAENASACLLKTHPWFGSSAYHCAIVEIRCTNHRLITSSGDADELDAFLRFLYPKTVKGLVFSSCARLQMPPVIAQFANLQLIKIYNSTIANWEGEATLTGTNHPHMQFVYIVNSNMTEVPEGLLSKDDFPPTLADIEFCGTNLTKLPLDVGVTWSPLYFFALERSPGISEFPAPLAQLQLSYIFLQSNSIVYIPDDLLANQTLRMLGLSNNPLERLPEKIGDISKLVQVFMRSTPVGELPAWMVTSLTESKDAVAPQTTVEVEASGSRLCAELDASALLSVISPLFALSCMVDDSPGANYFYPLEQENQWRQHK